MDNLSEGFSSAEEAKQLKKLQMYQKLVLYLLLKYKWSIIGVFFAALLLGLIIRYIQFNYTPYKYEASVTLFYTPRASEEVKTLSINHVLGIFSRQQVFQQLIKELNLSEKQRGSLKKGIEVKLLKDQNDMFKITGKAHSDEHVKILVNTFTAIGIRNYDEYRTAELRNYLNARENRMFDLRKYQETQIKALHGLHAKYGIIHPIEEMNNVKKIQSEQKAMLSELTVKLTDARHKFSIAERKYKAVPQPVILCRNALRSYTAELRKRLREYEKAKLIFSEKNPRFVESYSNYEVFKKEFENFKKANKIDNFNESMLIGLDGICNEYAAAEITLSQLNLTMKSLQAEMQYIREREKKLQHMIPEHERVEELTKTIKKNISLLVEELTRVRSSIAHVPNDIIINERVTSTIAYPRFPVKILALLFIGAGFIAAIYTFVIIALDILYGHFGGIEEAIIHKDYFTTVGVLPDTSVEFTPAQRAVLTNEMFYHFVLRLKDTRTLFSCSLNGSFLSSVMFDEQFTKANRNTILVRLISERDVDKICAGMEKIGDFYYSDNGTRGSNYLEKKVNNQLEYLQGFSTGDGLGYGYGYGFAYFPIRHTSGLEPDEISKLYAVINELKKHYQLIRVSREQPFNASCLMVRQLHDICDATMLYIGKRKTPRAVLRRVLKLHDENHKVYAILTNVTDVEKIISGDYIL